MLEGELTQEIRGKLSAVLRDVQIDAHNKGLALRCVGSLGVFSLLGKEPRLLRKVERGPDGLSVEAVDIDLLVGWEEGVLGRDVKQWADHWWKVGMSSAERVRFPVSVVNLPKEVANDPSSVLGFKWIMGKEFSYTDRDNNKTPLPMGVVDEAVVARIFETSIVTLTPAAHVLIKMIARYDNPIRWIRYAMQSRELIEKYPDKQIKDYRRYLRFGLSSLVITRLGRLVQ